VETVENVDKAAPDSIQKILENKAISRTSQKEFVRVEPFGHVVTPYISVVYVIFWTTFGPVSGPISRAVTAAATVLAASNLRRAL
jgi:hypothetical protein